MPCGLPGLRYIYLNTMKSGDEGTMSALRKILLSLAILIGPAAAAAAEPVNVFAAASLKNALDAVSQAWKAEAGKKTRNTYAASSALAKQIEQGAPADVFISADLDWMDYLAERKLIKPETRFNLLGNQLVLIAPKDSTLSAKIEPGFPIAALLGDGRLAMAAVDSVPA